MERVWDMQEVDRVSGLIVDCGVRLHQRLGPGLLESVYETALAQKLVEAGLYVQRQKSIDFLFDGHFYEGAFKADLVVNGLVLVELKCCERLAPAHFKQVLTYLRLTDFQVGLLMNFGGNTLKEGLHRVVNGYVPSGTERLRLR